MPQLFKIHAPYYIFQGDVNLGGKAADLLVSPGRRSLPSGCHGPASSTTRQPMKCFGALDLCGLSCCRSLFSRSALSPVRPKPKLHPRRGSFPRARLPQSRFAGPAEAAAGPFCRRRRVPRSPPRDGGVAPPLGPPPRGARAAERRGGGRRAANGAARSASRPGPGPPARRKPRGWLGSEGAAVRAGSGRRGQHGGPAAAATPFSASRA